MSLVGGNWGPFPYNITVAVSSIHVLWDFGPSFCPQIGAKQARSSEESAACVGLRMRCLLAGAGSQLFHVALRACMDLQ